MTPDSFIIPAIPVNHPRGGAFLALVLLLLLLLLLFGGLGYVLSPLFLIALVVVLLVAGGGYGLRGRRW